MPRINDQATRRIRTYVYVRHRLSQFIVSVWHVPLPSVGNWDSFLQETSCTTYVYHNNVFLQSEVASLLEMMILPWIHSVPFSRSSSNKCRSDIMFILGLENVRSFTYVHSWSCVCLSIWRRDLSEEDIFWCLPETEQLLVVATVVCLRSSEDDDLSNFWLSF